MRKFLGGLVCVVGIGMQPSFAIARAVEAQTGSVSSVPQPASLMLAGALLGLLVLAGRLTVSAPRH